MGGDNHIGEGEKPGGGGVHHDVVLVVFEDIGGFFLIDIQTHTEEFPLTDVTP